MDFPIVHQIISQDWKQLLYRYQYISARVLGLLSCYSRCPQHLQGVVIGLGHIRFEQFMGTF